MLILVFVSMTQAMTASKWVVYFFRDNNLRSIYSWWSDKPDEAYKQGFQFIIQNESTSSTAWPTKTVDVDSAKQLHDSHNKQHNISLVLKLLFGPPLATYSCNIYYAP
jgi:hypothetical protein